MKYNYENKKIVILGNGIDWLDGCFEKRDEAIIYYNNLIPLKTKNKLLQFIIKCFYSIKNKKGLIIKLPFRGLFYNLSFFKNRISPNDNIYFIFYDHNKLSLDLKYIKWIRKKYVNCKLIYVFTNVVSKSVANDYGMVSKLNDIFDIVYAFDKEDSIKYNFEYYDLIYSPQKNYSNNNFEFDCLFVGYAKERLNELHCIYNKLICLGLKPCFYINKVDEKDMLINSSIVYNKRIPYKETIELIKKSKCILDILQSGSSGFTLRVCESIVWNKLLITNNDKIVEAPYFNDNMQIIKGYDDIEKNFFNKKILDTTEYECYFSIDTFLNKIDSYFGKGDKL